jgi:methyl-accepting chemotaxis protein
MNFFNNLKVGTKILSGFILVLTLMGIVGGLAIFQFTQVKKTFTDLTDNLAKDQYLSEQLVTHILLLRFYANQFIRVHKHESLARFNKEFALVEKWLAEADIKITKNEQIKMLTDIKAKVQAYGKNFEQVVRLMDKRKKTLLERFNVLGPLAEEKLEQLRESAFQANDAIASFYAGNAQRALLLIRLDVFKYLEEGEEKWIEKIEKRYQEVQIAFNKLDEELQDNTRRQLAQSARIAIDKYRQGFTGLQAGYSKQNQIIETLLNVIGPEVRKTTSKISESIKDDFDSTNQKAHRLVDQTRLQLLITMMIAIFMGIGFALIISRSITIPLGKVIEMSHQMLKGNMNQIVDVQSSHQMKPLISRQDEIGNLGRAYDALANYFKVMIEDIVQVLQGLSQGNLQVVPKAEYQGDFVKIKDSMETTLFILNKVIKDIVIISQGLAEGGKNVVAKAEYQGDFIQIKEALETGATHLQSVVEDIIQISQGLAEGGQNVVAKAEYQGDFIQIKEALESAATKLAEATAKNAIQDWLKTGQTQLSQQLSGEQDVLTLANHVITFLTTYLEAQVSALYLLDNAGKNACLKLLASYAYTQRKGTANEFQLGEGLIGQAALEKERIIVTEIPEDYISIQSGLGEAVPQQLLVIPFLYENVVKGIIEIGSFHEITEVQLELLDQVMPHIGIAVNTAESRAKMQALLQQK